MLFGATQRHHFLFTQSDFEIAAITPARNSNTPSTLIRFHIKQDSRWCIAHIT
jgi:hypothetical protein